MGKVLKDNIHRCVLPYGTKGMIYICDCGQAWWCKPYSFMPDSRIGEWQQISNKRLAELTGEVEETKIESETAYYDPPKRRRWWQIFVKPKTQEV